MTNVGLEESLARRADAEDEARARKRESILQGCKYKNVPAELCEILADDADFIGLIFVDEGFSSFLRRYLRDYLVEHIDTLIYIIVSTEKHDRRDPPMSLLYNEILEAIDKMEDEE